MGNDPMEERQGDEEYVAPMIQILGEVADLTQGSGGSGTDSFSNMHAGS